MMVRHHAILQDMVMNAERVGHQSNKLLRRLEVSFREVQEADHTTQENIAHNRGQILLLAEQLNQQLPGVVSWILANNGFTPEWYHDVTRFCAHLKERVAEFFMHTTQGENVSQMPEMDAWWAKLAAQYQQEMNN